MEDSSSEDFFTDGNESSSDNCLVTLPCIPTDLKPNDLYYSMKETEMGLALIFSHTLYDEIDGKQPGTRHGTSADVVKLEQTFSALRFEIKVYEDKTYEEIMEIILQVSRMGELMWFNSLVVFILTHGDECELLYAKDKTYYVKEIVEPFTGRNCVQLANKPKLFFIQACKGKKAQKGITLRTMIDGGPSSAVNKTCMNYCIPEISDVLISYATIEGYTAVRDEETGSPYVQSLCQELYDCGTEDLLSILIRVHNRIATSMFLTKSSKQIKVQLTFLCYLNRFVRFNAPPALAQTQ